MATEPRHGSPSALAVARGGGPVGVRASARRNWYPHLVNGSVRDADVVGQQRMGATTYSAHEQVIEMQRSRLVVAAVGSVVEHGWGGASVANITERAGISRRTFYEMFENREECLLAVLEGAVSRITTEIIEAKLEGLPWRERVREGLWRILCFFDWDPALARVCVLESRRGEAAALAYRQRILDKLAKIVQEGGKDTSNANTTASLTAHGVVGGIAEVLYSRLLNSPDEPLRDLLGQLVGMIVLPYMGIAAAAREQARPAPPIGFSELPQKESNASTAPNGDSDPLAALPMRLTYRTALVLQAVAEHPGQSNRQVADLVGISDQGQASKLLSRLAQLGLLTNSVHVKGERNKWTLTPTGKQVTRSIKPYAPNTHATGNTT